MTEDSSENATVCERATIRTTEVARPDGTAALHTRLAAGVSETENERFAEAAELMKKLSHRSDILTIHEVAADRRSFTSELLTVGACEDLPALRLRLDRKLDLIRRVCIALDSVHELDAVHACVCAGNILFDDDMHPVLSEVGMIDVFQTLRGDPENDFGYGAYSSPEARHGQPCDARADVYSVGKLCEFVLGGVTPEMGEEAVPPLSRLAETAPAGLVRIVRRCILADARARYASMKELVADLDRYGDYDAVGTALTEPNERNLTGLMYSDPTALAHFTEPIEVDQDPWTRLSTVLGFVEPTADCNTPTSSRGSQRGADPTNSGRTSPSQAHGQTESRRRRRIAGVSMASFAIMSLAVFTQPVGALTRWSARSNLESADPMVRADAVRTLARKGERDLGAVLLPNAALSEVHLTGASLVGADFTDADLRRSDLSGADLQRSRLSGALLGGADLRDTNLHGAFGLDTASCDEATLLPEGWVCVNGRPKKTLAAPSAS